MLKQTTPSRSDVFFYIFSRTTRVEEMMSFYPLSILTPPLEKLDDGWPESKKENVFQAALRMVVVKDSR